VAFPTQPGSENDHTGSIVENTGHSVFLSWLLKVRVYRALKYVLEEQYELNAPDTLL
jgi:hypothetical protein